MNICQQCQKEFLPDKFHPTALYCCSACRVKAWILRNPERIKEINRKKNKKWHKANRKWVKKYNKNYWFKVLKPNREKSKAYTQKSLNRARFSGNRLKVLERDGYKCGDCGTTEKLHVHHIDGNGRGSKNPNNDMNNLITLCRKCHGKRHGDNQYITRYKTSKT